MTKQIVNCCLAVAAILTSPIITKADLLLTSGSSYIADSNFDGTTYTVNDYNEVFHSGFSESGSLTGTYSNLTYSFTQSGGVTHLDWSGSTLIPARDTGDSTTAWSQPLGYVNFTPTIDRTYSISSSFTDSGLTGEWGSFAYLYDWNDDNYLYIMNDLRTPYGSGLTYYDGVSGVLIAGHDYTFYGSFHVGNYKPVNGYPEMMNNPGSATGEWHLTLSPVSSVPEPSSVALAGLGGIGLIVGVIRRRRAAV